LTYTGFGYGINRGFKPVNKWTNIQGLENYTNIEKGSQIPNSPFKGTRFTSSRGPCDANPQFCNDDATHMTNWTGAYIGTKSCFKYG